MLVIARLTLPSVKVSPEAHSMPNSATMSPADCVAAAAQRQQRTGETGMVCQCCEEEQRALGHFWANSWHKLLTAGLNRSAAGFSERRLTGAITE